MSGTELELGSGETASEDPEEGDVEAEAALELTREPSWDTFPAYPQEEPGERTEERKAPTAAEQRNFYKTYNEQLRLNRIRAQFAPELGVGPTFDKKSILERERQVCCCGLQCALTWSAFIDTVISFSLSVTYCVKVSKDKIVPNIPHDLSLMFSILFLGASILLFTGVTKMKKPNALLWIFVVLSPCLLVPSFTVYYVKYYSGSGWLIPVWTGITGIYKAYQAYLVILFIRAPQKKYSVRGEVEDIPLNSFLIGDRPPPKPLTTSQGKIAERL